MVRALFASVTVGLCAQSCLGVHLVPSQLASRSSITSVPVLGDDAGLLDLVDAHNLYTSQRSKPFVAPWQASVGKGAFEAFIKNNSEAVHHWKVEVSSSTDRVAVTIVQPANERDLSRFEFIIRSVSRRLGPEWGLQIFYGREVERQILHRALGEPKNVIWSPLKLAGVRKENITKKEANWFRLSMDFWGQIAHEHEHVLIFEADSLLLGGHDCIDRFLKYSYVGAPWNFAESKLPGGKQFLDGVGGNGGFTLRRRSAMVAVVESRGGRKVLAQSSPEAFSLAEDIISTHLILHYFGNESFPPREEAKGFSVEGLMHASPCAIHKPWPYIPPEKWIPLLHL